MPKIRSHRETKLAKVHKSCSLMKISISFTEQNREDLNCSKKLFQEKYPSVGSSWDPEKIRLDTFFCKGLEEYSQAQW